jgi:hypothetical protein
MKYLVCFSFMLMGCKDPYLYLKQSEFYAIAVKNLEKDHVENFKLLSEGELEEQNYFLFGRDTVALKMSYTLFGFKDKNTDELYIYRFYPNSSFNRYKCTPEWEAISELVQLGDPVYLIPGKAPFMGSFSKK